MGNVKYWDGSSWVEVNNIQTEDGGLRDITAVKRWDGSQWVEVWSPLTIIESFERTSPLDEYADLNDNIFSISTSTVESGSKALEATYDNTNLSNRQTIVSTDFSVSAGNTYRSNFRFGTLGSGNSTTLSLSVGFGVQDETSFDGYAISGATGTDEFRILRFDNGAGTNLASTTQSYTANDWWECDFEWGSSGSLTATLYDETGTQTAQLTATDTTYSSGGIGFSMFNNFDNTQSIFADYVRKV